MADRPSLPYIDINNFSGLFTQTNPEVLDPTHLRECVNFDFVKEYGAISKIRGTSSVLDSQYTEGGIKDIGFIGFYKASDLDGGLQRHRIVQAGTKFHKEENGALTEIGSGEPEGLFRTSDSLDRFMYITAQDPFRNGKRGTPRRWDGEKLVEWGVTAPGRQETPIEEFESTSGWTVNNGTIELDNLTAWKDNSIKLTSLAGSAQSSIEKLNVTPFAPNDIIEDRLEISFFINRTDYRKLTTSGRAVSIYYGSDADLLDNYYRYDFKIGRIFPGWNTFKLDFSSFPAGDFGTKVETVPGSIDDTSMKSYKFEVITQNTSDIVTVNFDSFTALDQGTPDWTYGTAATGGEAGVFPHSATSIWSYRVTFVDENAKESNGGPVSVAVDLSAEFAALEKEAFDSVAVGEWDDDVNAGVPAATTSGGRTFLEFDLGGAAVESSVAKSGMNLDLDTDAKDSLAYIDVFIPLNSKQNLATSAFEITMGEAGLTDYNKWKFSETLLNEDEWTTLTIDLANPDEASGTPDMSDIDTIKVAFNSLDAATTDADFGVDTLKINSALGYESIELDNIPISENPAVTRRRIYRSVANGNDWLFVGAIDDNTTSTFSDTVSDGALGVTTPPLAGQFDDTTGPPSGGIFKIWKRTGFMAGDPRNPSVLYFSLFDNVDAWPIINAFEFDEPITGIFKTYLGLVVTTQTAIWRVIGDNPDYVVDKVIDQIGGVGSRACGEARASGWFVDKDGLRLYDLKDTIKISENIRDRIEAFPKEMLHLSHTVHYREKNAILWFIPDGTTGRYNTAYMYQYSVDDIRSGWWSELDIPVYLNYLHIAEVEDDDGNFQLWAGADDGMIYRLFDPDSSVWHSVYGDIPITCTFQTRWLRLGSDPVLGPLGLEQEAASGRVDPQMLEIRARDRNGSAMSWTTLLESADASVDDSNVRAAQTLTMEFSAGMSLIRQARTHNFVPAEFIRLNVSNSETDIDPAIYGVRIQTHIRPGQFEVLKDRAGGQN